MSDPYYHQYKPSSLLENAIECYWIFRGANDPMEGLQGLIPGGRIECIFHLRGPVNWLISGSATEGYSFNLPFILGQRDRIFYAKPGGNVELLGIRFKPGGFGLFSKVTADILLNRIIPAHELLSGFPARLDHKLRSDITDSERIFLVEDALAKLRLAAGQEFIEVREMIDSIRKCDVPDQVSSFCSDRSIHYKKLERVFLKWVGYGPKSYFRILRFNRALKEMAPASRTLTGIAHGGGYYDQSHFIRDFRQFAGTSPGKFNLSSWYVSSLLIKHQPV
ncbi:MAG: DUF6597 domain-containing transcriptional factor [Chitinophagales bacterium]